MLQFAEIGTRSLRCGRTGAVGCCGEFEHKALTSRDVPLDLKSFSYTRHTTLIDFIVCTLWGDLDFSVPKKPCVNYRSFNCQEDKDV